MIDTRFLNTIDRYEVIDNTALVIRMAPRHNIMRDLSHKSLRLINEMCRYEHKLLSITPILI